MYDLDTTSPPISDLLEHDSAAACTDLIPVETTIPATLEDEIRIAASYAKQDTSEATRRAYRGDWRAFEAWCRARGLASLPALPAAVATFLAYEAEHGAKASTIGRRCAAIRYYHRQSNYPTPTDDESVRKTMRGIRRSIGVAPIKKSAATADQLVHMIPPTTDTRMIAIRDRALLLIGFSIAARRSELVALDRSDIEETKDGLIIRIKRSKTDQEGAGATVAVPYGSIACPVKALRAWLEAAGNSEGPVFRSVNKGGRVLPERLSDKSVASIVKKHAARIGLDANDFAGHSLRAGFCTSAATRGANIFKIMDVSRHRSVDTLKGYVRSADAFKDHAASGLL
jgi:site-specific recombinase XerD